MSRLEYLRQVYEEYKDSDMTHYLDSIKQAIKNEIDHQQRLAEMGGAAELEAFDLTEYEDDE